MRYLGEMAHLTSLILNRTRITDDGLKHLSRLPELRCLYLSQTNVTNRSVEFLTSKQSLQHLDVQETQIDPEGARILEEKLPDASIRHGRAYWSLVREGTEIARGKNPSPSYEHAVRMIKWELSKQRVSTPVK